MPYVNNHFNHPHDGVSNGLETVKSCVVVLGVDGDDGVGR